jgi:Outer membrane protein beta-barrel domain
MSKKLNIGAVLLVAIFSFTDRQALAQSSDYKFELGGQFSALDLSSDAVTSTRVFPCQVPPCPFGVSFERARHIEPGFGGRIGYRAGNYITVEAEVNFFPRDRVFEEGRKVQGLFGAKVGSRWEKVGVFGKARPGFLYLSKGNFEPRPDVGCPAVFPPPVACFEGKGKTGFALDVGGVLELYPSPRTMVRFDLGDTIVHLSDRNVAVSTLPPFIVFPGGAIISRPAETTHNVQASVGFGFRF